MYKLVVEDKELLIKGIVIDSVKWLLRSMDAPAIEDRIMELPIVEGYIGLDDIYHSAIEECEDDDMVHFTGIELIDGLVNNRLARIHLYDDDMVPLRTYIFRLERL